MNIDIHTCHAECQRPACVAVREREKIAKWMMERGYATGHGETIEDLLAELDWQIAENWTQAMVKGVETEREACAKVCEAIDVEYEGEDVLATWCAAAIRERTLTKLNKAAEDNGEPL